MTTIVLRQNVPEGLSIAQIDANFTNLNNDKVEKTDDLYIGTTAIKHNRASASLDISGVTIPVAGVRADTASNGKTLRLVAGVSSWEDDSIQALSDDTATNATYYPLFVDALTGTKVVKVSSSKLYYNPSLGQLNANHFNVVSDLQLKTNVTPILNATVTVGQLAGVEYNMKDTGNKSSGVIAQELEKILPHLVSEADGIKSVNYNGLVAYLIESIKELDARVKTLEDK